MLFTLFLLKNVDGEILCVGKLSVGQCSYCNRMHVHAMLNFGLLTYVPRTYDPSTRSRQPHFGAETKKSYHTDNYTV